MGCVRVYMQKIELRYWCEYGDEKAKIFERLIFVLEFGDFPNCLDVGKGRKLPTSLPPFPFSLPVRCFLSIILLVFVDRRYNIFTFQQK